MCPTENPALQLFIFSGRWIDPKSINTAVPESYLKVLILIKDLGQILHNKCSLPPSSKSLQKHHVSTFKAEISSHSSPGAPLYITLHYLPATQQRLCPNAHIFSTCESNTLCNVFPQPTETHLVNKTIL